MTHPPQHLALLSRWTVAGVVLALVVNGPAATGLALADTPEPTPSAVELVARDSEPDDPSAQGASGAGDVPEDQGSESPATAPSEGEAETPAEAPADSGQGDSPEAQDSLEAPEATGVVDEAPSGLLDAGEVPTSSDDAANSGSAVAPAAADAITPLATGDATIRVRKAGDRLGDAENQGASGLAGAVFTAYAKGRDQTQSYQGLPVAATCTTDATGTCDLQVDSALGPRYVVVEQSAPTGWRTIEQIALGGAFDVGTPRDYRWNVAVSARSVTDVPRTEIRNVSGQSRWSDRRVSPSTPSYQWADARDNVPLPPAKCGLNVAMLFDQSGSIGSNLSLVKDAAKEFIDDLTGTPTSIALFTFATTAPQNNFGSRNRPALVSIADASGANQVKGYIDGFSQAGGGTNWDAGLRRVAAATQQYDVLIVLTDGNPTAWEGDRNSTSVINDYDVENAVHSANWVKSEGTRIVAIGLSGQTGGLTPLNLQHISGTVQNDDYYLTTFGDLDNVLSEIALNGCGGTVNVQKRVAPTWTGIQDVPLEPGWDFARDPSQGYVAPASGTTGPAGEPVTFKVTFDQGQLEREVTISENSGSYALVPDPLTVPGTPKNARCLVNNSPIDPRRIVNVANGFTVTGVTDKEIVSCLVVNSAAQATAVKYNDLDADGTRGTGEPGLPGWTLFLDANRNGTLDASETSATTDAQGAVLFDRLVAPATYRVCEIRQDGWFNTDPGGAEACKDQAVAVGQSAGPVLFGNAQRGSFQVTKEVVDESGFIPSETQFTVEVRCTLAGSPVVGFSPRTLTLTAGQTVTVGPLVFGTVCNVTELPAAGAISTVDPSSVTIGPGAGVRVSVTNTYPAGLGEVVKVVDGALAGELAPPGTEFTVDVECTFPAGYPVAGPIPGYNPKALTIKSGATVGQPGPPAGFGPLPVGSTCTAAETDNNGADPSVVTPGSVTIAEGAVPVRVTVTNTFRPAALVINKVVNGAGAGLVPEATVFVAEVTCSNGLTTQVEFGVKDPGIVSGLPVGTSCTVTEIDSQGAAWSPQNQTVVLQGADPVKAAVTITNTFGAGQLTVTKVVDDPSGLVASGTEYTINVACTFAGNALPGFPKSVVLTTANGLTQTLLDLPYGTQCRLSEPNLNGAASVTFAPSATVTVDGSNPEVTVTATNTYPVGTFPITKEVGGPGASFVPVGTQFKVTATCTLPVDFPGADPAPIVVTITAASPGLVGPLPVGTTCTLAETDSAGAGSASVVPDKVTIAAGAQNATVVVTNTYPVGSFTVAKLASGPGAAFVPPLTSYDVSVTCTYPDTHPAAPGIVTGFDGRVVTISTGSKKGVPGIAVPVGPLPVGAVCTTAEPDLNGASAVSITPNPVTVPGGQDPTVNVVVENTYPAGSGQIVKVATGALAAELAPEGTVFLVEVRCTFPANFPGQNPAGPNPDPIPGYFPRELAIGSGPSGQPGIPTQFGPLPIGSTCTIIETDSRGATPVEISPPGGGSVGSVTISDSQAPVTVTVTNTFNPAALRITKVVTGPGAALLPPETAFTARVVCTFQGQTTFSGDVPFSVAKPGAVTDQPIGATCTVTETNTNGATNVAISPPSPLVLEGRAPVLVDVAVTNAIPAGQLTVQKVIAGGAASVVPEGVEFTVGVECSFQGSPLPGYPEELTFVTPDQLSRTLTGLPVGAVCAVNESDDGGATSVEYGPPAGPNDPAGQSGVVTIAGGAQQPVTVTVRNIFEPAVLQIAKQVAPQGVLLPPGLRFIAQVDCTFADEAIYSGEVKFGVGSPGVVSGLIVGAECTVVEKENFGASFEPPSQTVVLEGDDPVTVDVTITNTFQTGVLTVAKTIDDGGTGLVPTDTPFVIDVTCRFEGLVLPRYPTAVSVTPGQAPVGLPGLLPVGTVCDLAEQDLQGAASVTFTPGDSVTITSETPDVAVTATNVYPIGELRIVKEILGSAASTATGPFEFSVTCTFLGAPLDPQPATVRISRPALAATVGGLPVGAVCTVAELAPYGGADGPPVITPSTVVVDQGSAAQVVARNMFTAPPTPPTAKPETCDPAKLGAQLPGSITVPANTEFAYKIGGAPYPAGTFPFSAGSYQVMATRVAPVPVTAAGIVRQLATQTSYTWTVVVPGSDVCAALEKSADPPPGATVFTGDLVTYAITVQNGGDTPVLAETLVDTLPKGADPIASSITPASGVYDKKARTITWTFDLPAASGGVPTSATFGYQVEVTSDDGSLVNTVSWVERTLTDRTDHLVEPGITGEITDKPPTDQPPTGELTDTGAGAAMNLAGAGLVAVLLGGLMVEVGRRRRIGG